MGIHLTELISAGKGRYLSLMADMGLMAATLLWAGEFVVAKDAMDSIGPNYMNFIRFGGAFLLAVLFFFKQMQGFSRKEFIGGLITGFFMGCGFVFQTMGLAYTTVGVNAFLTTAYVILIPFIMWVISKHRPPNKIFLGGLLCIVGIGILSLDARLSLGHGEFLALLGMVSYAFSIVSLGIYCMGTHPVRLMTVQFFVTSTLSIIAAIIVNEPFNAGMCVDVWPQMLYLVIAGTMATQLLTNICMKYTDASHTGIIFSLEAVFATLLAVVFLNEPIQLKFLFGSFLIFIAIYIIEKNNKLEEIIVD